MWEDLRNGGCSTLTSTLLMFADLKKYLFT
jgi:hypothetical protein